MFDKLSFDKVLGQLQRGTQQVRARGEAVTQSARLRLEIFGLNRELDALYGRLGRAYHAGANADILTPIQDEIERVDGQISARERQIAEIGARGEAESGPTEIPSAEGRDPSPIPKELSMTKNDDPVNASDADLLCRDAARDEDLAGPRDPAPASIERNRDKDLPNQDYQERLDQGESRSAGTKTDADLHGSSAPIPTLGTNAANADEIENRPPVQPDISAEDRHQELLGKEEDKEAAMATRDPDPLG